jgi:spore coat protein H
MNSANNMRNISLTRDNGGAVRLSRREFARRAGITGAGLLFLSSSSCRNATEIVDTLSPSGNAAEIPDSSNKEKLSRPTGWSKESHGNDLMPNYSVVFPNGKVNRLNITVSSTDWVAMQENLAEIFRGTGQPGGGLQPQPPGGQQQPPPVPGGGGGDFGIENPVWVSADIEFEGITWTKVGLRYKGNSSLRSGYQKGTTKLPLKLDFDQFEDAYPEINNQRFFGFKQLTLSNAFSDGSYMRDALTASLLDEAGLIAARTAYYEIFLDYGQGQVNLGLYVAIEVIDDTVITRALGDDSGNIYEGDGPGTSLAKGVTIAQIQASFQKENNTETADWSDIRELWGILHSTERNINAVAWRARLEAAFDVDAFLEWLAIAAVLQHWDTYGSMSHNFYLYHDPVSGRLIWISWDHNMVLGIGGGAGGPGGQSVSLDRENVGANWPLIRFLLDDPVYYTRYLDFMADFIRDIFDQERLKQQIQSTADLIAPFISSRISFDAAVQQLINNISQRHQAAEVFLTTQGK